MKPFEKLIFIIGLVLLVLGIYVCVIDYQASTVSPVKLATPIITATSSPIPKSVKPLVTPTSSATPVPKKNKRTLLVDDYVLNEKIDLSSGKSMAMWIQLSGGENILSSWADAIAYQSGDDELLVSPFDPKAGTIYTILGDTAVVVAHSGRRNNNWDLFASSLDRYLRVVDITNPKFNESISLEEGAGRLSGMIGSTVYLCQSREKMKPFTVFERCLGNVVKLKLVGGQMVGPEKLDEYGLNILRLRSWLATSYPEAGFDLISMNTGIIFVTCVQRFDDQPALVNLHNYEYNRVFLALEVVP